MSCKMIKTLAASSLMGCLLLNACGGGGGGGGSAPETSSVPPVIATGMDVDCTGCGATSKTAYSGSGVGVWTYKNTQASAVSLPVSISGLNNNSVTVVYTNQGSASVAMPSIALAPAAQDVSAYTNTLTDSYPKDPAPASMIAQREEFARLLHSNATSLKSSQAPAYAAAVVGDSRSINTESGGTTTVTMKKIVTTQDGTVVNFWVDNNEFGTGKISMTTIDTFASKYATGSNSIYTLVTDLIGKPWGAHGYSNLIPASQPINIVFYSANGAGWGGYFSPNDELTTSYCSTNSCTTNAWLAFYINTEQLYESNTASVLATRTNYYISVLAHEFTHMIHQYQRDILLGKKFATWLNELSAMSMEDIVASKIFTTDYNTARDQRFVGWLNTGNFNCQQDIWLGLATVNGCNSYNINGSFGAFLNRQYGIAYYKAMFASGSADSVLIMDGAIKAAGGAGYQDALRRWGDSIAMYPAASAPAGHGFPLRTDSSGYSLVGFDGPAFKKYRILPTTAPTSLAPHGHFPFVRSGVSGIYSETLTIPANTSVTVVIQ